MLRFAPLVFASCLLFQGCVPEADPIIDVVSVEQARVLIETNDDLIILDVRTPEEFDAGHIDNATNIDVLGEDFRTLRCSCIAGLAGEQLRLSKFCRSLAIRKSTI